MASNSTLTHKIGDWAGKWPRILCSLILIITALSHFIVLTIDKPSQHSANPVFPFLNNWDIYLVAGFCEFLTAYLCWVGRRRDLGSYAIIGFLLMIIWYRWAFHYAGGGESCGCLGVLGIAFHLTKGQERLVPIIVLAVLGFLASPWLAYKVARAVRFRRSTLALKCSVLCLFCVLGARGQDTVEVSGTYESSRHNPRTGAVYTDQSRRVGFTFTQTGDTWLLCATNLDDSFDAVGLRTGWEWVYCDSTNMYTCMPYHVKVGDRTWTVETGPKPCTNRITIAPGAIFIRDYDEWLDFDTIWLAYGLDPSQLPRSKAGLLDIPLPWFNARNTPMAFGFEWDITPSPDGRFVSECRVVSNTNLMLTPKAEMLRTSINPPLALGQYNHFRELTELRLQEKPNRFLEATYECTKWVQTNGLYIPVESEEKRYLNKLFPSIPAVEAHVKATSVVVRKSVAPLLPPAVAQRTLVTDYRYRRGNDKRVSPSLEYILEPGSKWKSGDDPDLLRTADQAFKTAPPVGYSRLPSAFTILVLALLVTPLAVAFMKANQKIS